MEDEATRPVVAWLKYGVGALFSLVLIVWLLSPNQVVAPKLVAKQHRIPVYYWHMWSGEWLPVMNHVCDEFNASQSRYEVIPLQVPYGEGDQKFLLSVAGGNPPDVMTQQTPAISTWAESGILQPLDPLMTPTEKKFFLQSTYPVIHTNGWYKGHLYGMVGGFDLNACYYRPSEFKKAGLDPNKFPQTLEELVKMSNKLTQTEASGRIDRIGFLPTGLSSYAPSFGGGFYDSSTGNVLTLTPQNLRALQYLTQTHKDIGFDRVMRYNAGLASDDGANWPFISGRMAITLDGEWRILQLAQYAPHMDYKIAPLPPPVGGIANANFSSTDFLTIPVGAKHAAGAWEFIKYWEGLDNPAKGAEFKTWFGWLPSSPEMAQTKIYQAYLRKYPQYRVFVALAASKHIITLPPVPYSVYLQDELTKDDDLAERGAVSPLAALTLLQSQIRDQQTQRKALGYDR